MFEPPLATWGIVMKKLLIVLLVFIMSLVAVNYLPVHGEEAIYDSVVRLHVIANSDSDEDQALKLLVRDAILAEMETLLKDCKTREEAETVLSKNIDLLHDTAVDTLIGNGCNMPVTVALKSENYPRKNYENICFPAGRYRSLQIRIGEAEGKNWWCVLFPQLCLSGAKRAERAFIEVGLTSDQYRIITETEDTKYRVRFKILETIEEAIN